MDAAYLPLTQISNSSRFAPTCWLINQNNPVPSKKFLSSTSDLGVFLLNVFSFQAFQSVFGYCATRARILSTASGTWSI